MTTADRSAIETVALGASGLRVPPIAVGTWAWGERAYWGYDPAAREGAGFGPSCVVDAFVASVDAGLTLFDTAEVYGHGESERFVGYLAAQHAKRSPGAPPLVLATKFAPLAQRRGLGARALAPALAASAKRLRVACVDLYQLHWADRDTASIETLADALADAVAAGAVRAVGVSNYSADELRRAHAALARRGVPLATQQVHYSLLHRAPEVDGVLDACRELGVTLLAYSPLAQGLLAGRYDAQGAQPPVDARARAAAFAPDNVRAAASVVARLRAIGAEAGGFSPAQVALAWLRAQGDGCVVPIAGARTGAQARENAGALGLALSPEACAALDEATRAWRAGAPA